MEHKFHSKAKLSAALLASTLCICVPLAPINAKSVEASLTAVQPRWWPGDPNPRPGSEAWLQQHASVKPGNMEVARRCALQALAPSGIGAGAGEFISWLTKGVWTVGSFAQSFGISWVVGYFDCIIQDAATH